MTQPFPTTLEEIREAGLRLEGVALRTPVIENPEVNEALGGRLLLKAENLQRTGAFKIRGAYHRMVRMTAEERKRGAVSYSSGNHALGLARAAQIVGSSAVIVMPSDVPPAKRDAVRRMGARIVTYERDSEAAADVIASIERETGRIEVPPSAHPQVLAGSGTAALELLEQARDLGITPDDVLVPCGGGGLTASTAIVMAEAAPGTRVFAVEPELFDDTCRSLAAGHRVANPVGRRTICDAIMTPIPNDVTFPVNLSLLAGGLIVTDNEVRSAMRFAFDHFKLVAEPGAVVGLAAVLSGRIDIRGRIVATFITGGNVDASRFQALIA